MQSGLRLFLAFLLCGGLLLSCTNKEKIPDVSNIKINLTTQRFERDLFDPASLADTIQLDKLQAKYPSFGENFLTTIMNCDPKWSADSTLSYVKGFTTAYKALYDTSQILFKDFTPYEKEIRQGLQFVNYYFPEYKFPTTIITYVGPVDGFGDILANDAIIVGLHQHLGKNYSLYQTGLVQETYPSYISNRFEPSYISVNVIKNIVLDMFPENIEDKPLVQQMVEKGKRLYVMSKLLPYNEENMLIGYTREQMEDCNAHEREIWDLFVQNNLLQSIDYNVTKTYIGDSPKTQELGDAAPGNIGSYAGWQIVKKFMNKNPKMSLKELMAMDNEKLFEEAKYKP